jgi:hypothetical protein
LYNRSERDESLPRTEKSVTHVHRLKCYPCAYCTEKRLLQDVAGISRIELSAIYLLFALCSSLFHFLHEIVDDIRQSNDTDKLFFINYRKLFHAA